VSTILKLRMTARYSFATLMAGLWHDEGRLYHVRLVIYPHRLASHCPYWLRMDSIQKQLLPLCYMSHHTQGRVGLTRGALVNSRALKTDHSSWGRIIRIVLQCCAGDLTFLRPGCNLYEVLLPALCEACIVPDTSLFEKRSHNVFRQ
jgi:hypothetical protein